MPPCNGECVTDALEPPISIAYSALPLIALLCVANTPFLEFIGYFLGQGCTGAGGGWGVTVGWHCRLGMSVSLCREHQDADLLWPSGSGVPAAAALLH